MLPQKLRKKRVLIKELMSSCYNIETFLASNKICLAPNTPECQCFTLFLLTITPDSDQMCPHFASTIYPDKVSYCMQQKVNRSMTSYNGPTVGRKRKFAIYLRSFANPSWMWHRESLANVTSWIPCENDIVMSPCARKWNRNVSVRESDIAMSPCAKVTLCDTFICVHANNTLAKVTIAHERGSLLLYNYKPALCACSRELLTWCTQHTCKTFARRPQRLSVWTLLEQWVLACQLWS